MSYRLTKEHENVTLPFIPSRQGRGSLFPLPLWERVRERGIFGSMTEKAAKAKLVIPACPESFFICAPN
jgi:hypothetical protein